jgi:HEAT repeat protein
VRAVGRTGAPGAVPALLSLLGRARRPVPEHCVTLALLRLGPAASGELTVALTGGRPAERAAAAAVLGWLGDLGCVDALCAALDEDHPVVVLHAIGALGRIGSPAAAARLRSRLSPDQPAGVRVAAAGALGRLGDPESSDLLAGLLTEEHDVARAAASALTQLGIVGRRALLRACDTVPEARELVATP